MTAFLQDVKRSVVATVQRREFLGFALGCACTFAIVEFNGKGNTPALALTIVITLGLIELVSLYGK